MSRNVLVINSGPAYVEMFQSNGWNIVNDVEKADILQFTGGEDVSPHLYKEHPHPTTHSNPERDRKETLIFKGAVKRKLPMAGICRGGQFLNVMCGGSLWQDVDNHAIRGTHPAIDEETGEIIEVTSTHHQMMRLGHGGVVVLTAHESGRRERVSHISLPNSVTSNLGKTWHPNDLEAIYYPSYRCFCFQPHPEFKYRVDLASYYFKCLDKYLFNGR